MLVTYHTLCAQNISDKQFLEHDTYVDLDDNTLFLNLSQSDAQLWAKVHNFLYLPISTKRRGVEQWQLAHIPPQKLSAEELLAQPYSTLSARIFASNSGYRVGADVEWGVSLTKGWAVSTNMNVRWGRDSRVEGVFRQDISPSVAVSRDFGDGHYLAFDIQAPYQMRGLRSFATQECYELTHNNLYNPSWGYYHGEVRNSRVLRNFTPTLSARYQRPITHSTIASIKVDAERATRKVSRLGWYDAANPTPNYYNKLPSYFLGSTAYDAVAESWQQNDTQYTQIAWDELERINLSSADGAAHYVVEDAVERSANISARVMFDTRLAEKIEVSYGGVFEVDNRRYYKEMRSLLGGTYLLDLDQYADDLDQTGTGLQNDLRNPNRKITNGDRFGYDYTLYSLNIEAMADINYTTSRSSLNIVVALGEESIHREGHYEKERFSGAESYGDSPTLTFSTYELSVAGGYQLSLQHHIWATFAQASEAPYASYLFINGQHSNRIISDPTTHQITSATVKYRYTSSWLNIEAEGYMVSSRNMSQRLQLYDDISSTYCNAIISDLATRSIGVEVCGEVEVGRRWRLNSTVACGGFIYSSVPTVRLYDDLDLSLVAESRALMFEGCVVGNAPQISTTFGSTYFGRRGFVLSTNIYYLAMRYTSPSVVRRTNRVVNNITSAESLGAIVSQQRLPDLVDGNISVSKSFRLRSGRRVVGYLKLENLFGGDNVIATAYEGNRVLANSSSGVTYGYTPQVASYKYAEVRRLYVSLKYEF